MKVLVMKMYRNRSLTMKVLLGLVVAGCFLPRQAGAQVTSISSFDNCVNAMATAGATVAQAASICVPSSGCYYTNTVSEESGQPACTLRDGTRLPRVIFSCTGPGGSQTLRFRPSFSLCTVGNHPVINHIELGEDVAQRIDHQTVMKMGDIAFPLTAPLTDATVLDTTTHRICTDCHDRLGAVNNVNLFQAIRPKLSEGTISTNDPQVVAPTIQVPLSTICAGINSSIQLNNNPTRKQLAYDLCVALLAKEQ
jgi:hypothetical protein